MARPAKTSPKNQPAPKKPLGRPSTYSEEMADKICEEIAQGAALYILCLKDGYPAERTVYQWLEKRPDFAQKYARARDRQQDRCVDEMIVIADGCRDPNKARIQIDARKWRASKLAPKKYGDKLELGSNPENPLALMIAAVQGTAIVPVEK